MKVIDNITDFFPSNYLRAADLGGKDTIATIDRVLGEEFEQDGRKRVKPVVYFRESGVKPLVCNKTNSMLIAAACGSDKIAAWTGKQVVLYPDLVSFKGKVSEAVRVKRAAQPAAAPAIPFTDELNGAIPTF
jgi:hypothetical protein